ncbi:hypothetical protein LCGC14_0902540 [marine sediment metagenome]|uniref:Uncharacterized protein n=1 Tax=marine sediment metagenome TaxID=412755 RepID=A0A0F9NW00_9ZZZZ
MDTHYTDMKGKICWLLVWGDKPPNCCEGYCPGCGIYQLKERQKERARELAKEIDNLKEA